VPAAGAPSAADVNVVNLAQAEAFTGITQPRIGASLEAGRWHRLERSDGVPLVCLESLLKST